MESTIAYISQGRLYVRQPNSDPREVECQFTERANDRARRQEERNGWKSRRAPFGMITPQMLWATQQKSGSGFNQIQITGAARGDKNELLFTLHTESVGGLFAHDPTDRSERRLYHRQGFFGQHLARHPAKDLVALSVQANEMGARIAITDTQGRRLREITEGDSIDQCPSWVPGPPEKETLVFQSAGIGRNAQGIQCSIGPYCINRLDLVAGNMETIVEDQKFDHLNPRVDSKGAIYFLRRPWSADGPAVSFKTQLLDALFFPFGLFRAIIHFCNFFSQAFSGKPLLRSGGPKMPGQDPTNLLLWGKVLDAEKALEAAKNGGKAELVPSDWELIRKTEDRQEVLAKSVASFDLASDGSVIYTNGIKIFHLALDGQSQTLCSAKLIEHVICL